MALKALIFDVDGTLAETEELHRESFNLAFKHFDLPWHWDRPLYKELLKVTGGKERIAYYCRDWKPKGAKRFDDFEEIVKMHKFKTDTYVALMAKGSISLRPGIEPLLKEARAAGLTLSICTTTSRPNLDILLKSTLGKESISWFKTIATGDLVTKKKPDPELFLLAQKGLGHPPQECLAFEDSKPGLLSAKGAGLNVLITASEYTDDETFDGALRVVNHLGTQDDLPKSLDNRAVDKAPITLKTLEHWFEQG